MSGHQSLVHLSNSDINRLLNECGVAVEFTGLDSPIHRQQIAAYDDSFSNFPSYARDVAEGLQEYVSACRNFQAANHKVAKIIRGVGSNANYSRCLFTNAFPRLGSLSDTLHSTADVFAALGDSVGLVGDGTAATAVPSMQQLQQLQQSFDGMRQLRRDMERSCADYEALLDHALRKKPTSKKPLSGEQKRRIEEARREYELQRFDIVRQINDIDCAKKLQLSKVCCSLQAFVANCSKSLQGALAASDEAFVEKRSGVQASEESRRVGERIYCGLRLRLGSELQGYLAPPGSPLQALSSVQSVRISSSSMPAYSCALTTELLSVGTAGASYDDMRHALPDDGIFKQGFLFVKSGELSSLLFGGARRRRWHRLYGSKLYSIDYCKEPAPSCAMTLVCDLAASQVAISRVHSEMPFKFALNTPEGAGKKAWSAEFQAENEDELLKWMAALRRCAALKGSGCSLAGEQGGSSQLARFVQCNSACCECSADKVSWISINLGITLCDDCALFHRQLTFSVSRLKSIKLDEFFSWQSALLLEAMGNDRCNKVWERSVLPGWTKPSPASPPPDKAQWIHAKYRWGAFVDDTVYEGADGLAAALAAACEEGSVSRAMEVLAHQGDVNGVLPGRGGACPLHVAVKGGFVHLSAYLAVNGADVCAEDFTYTKPLDLAEKSGIAELQAICNKMNDGFF